MDIQHEKGGFTMRSRTLLLFALAALLGAVVAVLPALAASPSETKLEVNQNCVEANWPCWTSGSGANPAPALKVMIAVGGDVMFTDHDASAAAAVVWMGSAPACIGVPTSAMTNWEGKCTFATPGTYKFESSTLFKEAQSAYGNNIDYTKYEVVVEGSTTTGTTGTTGTTTTPTMTTTSPASLESPLAGSESRAVKVAKSQRGGSVKGSLQISKAGGGDRLEVDLIATTASLAKARHATQVVGRFMSASVSAGQRSFLVKLNTKATRALKRHHRLALKVRIVLTPARRRSADHYQIRDPARGVVLVSAYRAPALAGDAQDHDGHAEADESPSSARASLAWIGSASTRSRPKSPRLRRRARCPQGSHRRSTRRTRKRRRG